MIDWYVYHRRTILILAKGILTKTNIDFVQYPVIVDIGMYIIQYVVCVDLNYLSNCKNRNIFKECVILTYLLLFKFDCFK